VAAPGNLRRIPHFISASTPRELMRRMLLTNVADGFEYKYFDIQFINGQWVAWYNRILNLREIKVETNGS
jgi:hypothetical protein